MIGYILVIVACHLIADKCRDLLCLFRRCGKSCTDGPYGFISKHDVTEIAVGQMKYPFFQLGTDHVEKTVGFALLLRFADTENRLQPMFHCSVRFFTKLIVIFMEIRAPFGMPQN